MTYTFLLTKKVGSPWDIFSVVSGRSAQIARTRFSCFKPGSVFCSLAFDFIYLTLQINELFESPGTCPLQACTGFPLQNVHIIRGTSKFQPGGSHGSCKPLRLTITRLWKRERYACEFYSNFD